SSSDEQSGVNWLVFFATNAAMTAGGVVPPYLERTSGSANDGVWTGIFTVPQHTRRGHWSFIVRASDNLSNTKDCTAADLASAGLQSGFDVLSDEDVTPPRLESFSIAPLEVDVHEADHTVRAAAHLTDDVSGVRA